MSMLVRTCDLCKLDFPEDRVLRTPLGNSVCLGCMDYLLVEHRAYEEREILFGDYEDDEQILEDIPF
jgi:hypothetical protein